MDYAGAGRAGTPAMGVMAVQLFHLVLQVPAAVAVAVAAVLSQRQIAAFVPLADLVAAVV